MLLSRDSSKVVFTAHWVMLNHIVALYKSYNLPLEIVSKWKRNRPCIHEDENTSQPYNVLLCKEKK